MKKLYAYLRNKDYRFNVNDAHGIYKLVPDKVYLKRKFKATLGYNLDLNHPKTFNEKLQWLKLYDRKPIYTTMVDKYAVKQYVADILGEQYIIPTLGVWDAFEEIDFDMLPNQFVLKCTHDSGGLVIVKDKSRLDLNSTKKKLSSCLKRNYYYLFREWPYKDVKPRIIAEQYMEDESGFELKDYKVLCFNGEPRLIEFHQGRFTDHQSQDFYDTNWNKTTISQAGLEHYQITTETFPKPSNLEEMLKLSKILSVDIPHLRVDWYSINNKLYFGELTFYDGSGFDPFDDFEDDLKLGSWILLPEINKL